MNIPSGSLLCRPRLPAPRYTHSMSIVRRVTTDVRVHGGVNINKTLRACRRPTLCSNEPTTATTGHLSWIYIISLRRRFYWTSSLQKTSARSKLQAIHYSQNGGNTAGHGVSVQFASAVHNKKIHTKEEQKAAKIGPRVRMEHRTAPWPHESQRANRRRSNSGGTISDSISEGAISSSHTAADGSARAAITEPPQSRLDKLVVEIHRADVKRRLEANRPPTLRAPWPHSQDSERPFEKPNPYGPPTVRKIHKSWPIPELADPPPIRFTPSNVPPITEPEWDPPIEPPPVRRFHSDAWKPSRPWPANVLPWLEPENEEQLKVLTMFLEELAKGECLDKVFKYYKALPQPRLPYLEMSEIHLLLSRYLSVYKRTDTAMLQYITIIDDMRNLQFPISDNEWAQILIYIGQRHNRRVEQAEIEAALAMWRETERQIGVRRTATIFNVLLDIAVDGKQPALVSAVLDEMKSRGVQYDRYTYTTLMKWYGKARDTKTIREVFRRLVSEGQIVDSVVLNALISSLLSSHDTLVAERIYKRMRENGAQSTSLPLSPFHVRASRVLGKRLKYAGNYNRKQRTDREPPDETGAMLDNVYAGPNIVTINMFLKLYCFEGDFAQVKLVFSDLEYFRINPESSVYISIARGFVAHGAGQRGMPDWTAENLEHFYGLMMGHILEDKSGAMALNTVLVCEWLMAFSVTTKDSNRVLEVYKDMEALWGQGKAEKKEIDWIVGAVLRRAIGRPIDVKNFGNPGAKEESGLDEGIQRVVRENWEIKKLRERYLVGFGLSSEWHDSRKKMYSAEEAKQLMALDPPESDEAIYSPPNSNIERPKKNGRILNIRKTFDRILRDY